VIPSKFLCFYFLPKFNIAPLIKDKVNWFAKNEGILRSLDENSYSNFIL